MAAFAGFGPKALPFFKALAFHQSKEWFDDNRALYESDVLSPMRALLSDASDLLAKRQLALIGDPKRGPFRLHRDVRFSKDKVPYKTHAGAVLTRSGAKNDPGLVYVHIDPEGCFFAAGFYHPEPAFLRDLRQRIYDKPKTLHRLTAHLKKHHLAFDVSDSLTRLPRDFSDASDSQAIIALKLKSFVVRFPLDEKQIYDPKLVEDLVDFAAKVDAVISWGRGEPNWL